MSLFEKGSRVLLRGLRLPPEPTPPFGAPGSVRVFRAGRNFYRLRLVVWSVTQVSTLAGLLVAIFLLHRLEQDAAAVRAAETVAESTAIAKKSEAPEIFGVPVALPPGAVQFAASLPPFVFVLLAIGELFGVVGFVVQIPITYAAVRLDFELRWYIVTDRSLRIRAGIFKLRESTMSFANIQQVVVSQGPLQRLLGIADLRVQSAGGGGAKEDQAHRDSLHTGIFHGVDNATEIRDLILERLRRFREAGLGDPDDRHELASPPARSEAEGAVGAAKEVLAEVRVLRHALEASSSGKR